MSDAAATPSDRLYALLPAIYRERDAAAGYQLRALLRVVEAQADLVEDDIEGLYQNLFVETCRPWAIPYLGDLVGAQHLFDAGQIAESALARQLYRDLRGPRFVPEVAMGARAFVAKTIYYRRRKSTLPVLEEIARDVTGYAAHGREFFEILGWTQNVRHHRRPGKGGTAHVRSVERVDRIDGPFDELAHTVDVRRIAPLEGWHGIRNIGLFLWRLVAFPLESVEARRVGAAGDFRYRFSPLGNDAPLFTRPKREGDEAGLAGERHVPGPIRPAAFHADLVAHQGISPPVEATDSWGAFEPVAGVAEAPDASLFVVLDKAGALEAVLPARVRCMDLSGWMQPEDALVGIDVRRGRIALGPAVDADRVLVYHHYGFAAAMGGGPYRRRPFLVRPTEPPTPALRIYEVTQREPEAGQFSKIDAALDKWASDGRPDAIVRILDSRSYAETLAIEPNDPNAATGRRGFLAIEAVDEERPHLRLIGPLAITGVHPEASLTLSGLLIEGHVAVQGSLGRLRLLHTTLVPGRSITDVTLEKPQPAGPIEPSLTVAAELGGTPANTRLAVEVAFSITGPLRLPAHAKGLWLVDSTVDGVGTPAIAGVPDPTTPGPPAWIERTTLLGAAHLKELPWADAAIFDALLTVERQGGGCVRFSFVPEGSRTPRRYRCQPDLAIQQEIEARERARGKPLSQVERDQIAARVRAGLRPVYTSRAYGQPGYAQLHLGCPAPIRTGAEDGAEMGAFAHLHEPQRLANLRASLDEYLPFGLESAAILVT